MGRRDGDGFEIKFWLVMLALQQSQFNSPASRSSSASQRSVTPDLRYQLTAPGADIADSAPRTLSPSDPARRAGRRPRGRSCSTGR